MKRPAHLPDFRSPPLDEVVVGVQFAPPAAYQQIRAGEVWELYRKDYPTVQEQSPLSQAFETFGLPSAVQLNLGQLNIGFVTGATHDRFWFVGPNGDELIQFQNDRLLHNWRKIGDKTNEYPHFELIIEKFEAELRTLETYMASLAPQRLKINQSEVTYINRIPCGGELGMPCEIEGWLKLFNIDHFGIEDFSCTFRRRVLDTEGAPYARLICQALLAAEKGGKNRFIQLNLTFRGAPRGDTIDAAIAFLNTGRQMIVEFFTQITTDRAHSAWERIQ